MATIVENPIGRRMIKLSADDVLMIVSLYQQKCNTKSLTYDDVRKKLNENHFYLPEEI